MYKEILHQHRSETVSKFIETVSSIEYWKAELEDPEGRRKVPAQGGRSVSAQKFINQRKKQLKEIGKRLEVLDKLETKIDDPQQFFSESYLEEMSEPSVIDPTK